MSQIMNESEPVPEEVGPSSSGRGQARQIVGGGGSSGEGSNRDHDGDAGYDDRELAHRVQYLRAAGLSEGDVRSEVLAMYDGVLDRDELRLLGDRVDKVMTRSGVGGGTRIPQQRASPPQQPRSSGGGTRFHQRASPPQQPGSAPGGKRGDATLVVRGHGGGRYRWGQATKPRANPQTCIAHHLRLMVLSPLRRIVTEPDSFPKNLTVSQRI
jgi:hypothetical protein